MNVTGQSLILRFIAIAFCLAAWFVFDRSVPVGIVLFGLGVVFSILGRRRSRGIQVQPTEQRKKTVFIAILGASVVAYAGTPVVLYWYDPKTDVRTLILVSAVLLPSTIGYYYWRLFKKRV
jgi:hypothetical protein